MGLHWSLPLSPPTFDHCSSVDFVVTAPTKGGQWANGAANVVSWIKGVGDGVDAFDIEMSRLTQDGIFYIAKDGA